MANIIEAFNDVFTEEYALAKLFVYAIPVFICVNAYATGQFVLSYFCGFFVIFLLLGLLTCGINNLRENKQEILTFNIQQLGVAIVKSAIAVAPHISIAGMIAFFLNELLSELDKTTQIPTIINLVVWCILISIITTSYLAFTKHLDVKEAYNFKLIMTSVIDVFVNLVFFIIQVTIADCICIGLMSYVFTVFNLPLLHPAFIFFCSLLLIVNLSVAANILSQASYEYIKGKDEDYKDRYKIGSTLATAAFSPGGITTSGSLNIQSPTQSRAEQSRNHLSRNNRGFSGRGSSTLNNKPSSSGTSSSSSDSTKSRGGLNKAPGTRRLGKGSTAGTGRSFGSRRPTNTSNSGNTGNASGKSNNKSSENAPKRKFGNSRRTGGSGFGNNKFGNKKKDNGGGFFKKK